MNVSTFAGGMDPANIFCLVTSDPLLGASVACVVYQVRGRVEEQCWMGAFTGSTLPCAGYPVEPLSDHGFERLNGVGSSLSEAVSVISWLAEWLWDTSEAG